MGPIIEVDCRCIPLAREYLFQLNGQTVFKKTEKCVIALDIHVYLRKKITFWLLVKKKTKGIKDDWIRHLHEIVMHFNSKHLLKSTFKSNKHKKRLAKRHL